MDNLQKRIKELERENLILDSKLNRTEDNFNNLLIKKCDNEDFRSQLQSLHKKNSELIDQNLNQKTQLKKYELDSFNDDSKILSSPTKTLQDQRATQQPLNNVYNNNKQNNTEDELFSLQKRYRKLGEDYNELKSKTKNLTPNNNANNAYIKKNQRTSITERYNDQSLNQSIASFDCDQKQQSNNDTQIQGQRIKD